MASSRWQALFGSETELGVFAESSGGIRPAPAELASAIIDDVGDRYPHARSPHPLPFRRIYLANGASVYGDVGGHPEIASAECTSPVELAAHVLALRRMVAESADEVGRLYGLPVHVVANNIDYGMGRERTYGHHVNVLVQGISLEEAVRQLTPLLAVLPVLAGAGKVSFARGSAGFELSQRAGHMSAVISRRTTESRAMVTAKDEPLSETGARLHVISLDTPISTWQLVLVPACLALSAKAAESGRDAAARWELADPIAALHSVSLDPSLRAELPLARGGTTTALEILEAYRVMAAETVAEAEAPAWTRTILSLWEKMLENLRTDPFLEYGRLGWVTKLVGFTEYLEQNQLSWKELSRWVYPLASIRQLKAISPELDPGRMTGLPVEGGGIRRSALGVLERHIAQSGLSWRVLPRIWKLANQLCGRCLQSHVLRPGSCQPEAGPRPCPLVSEQMVNVARTTPPTGTRAAIRGEAIREAAGAAEADWSFVRTGGRRLLMNDAFGRDASWEEENPDTAKED